MLVHPHYLELDRFDQHVAMLPELVPLGDVEEALRSFDAALGHRQAELDDRYHISNPAKRGDVEGAWQQIFYLRSVVNMLAEIALHADYDDLDHLGYLV